MTSPKNGLDRCDCGCKYWTVRGRKIVCFDCSEPFDPRDVHTEHCCSDHGCKYGKDDCTVTTGEKPQSYPCETCGWVREQVAIYLPEATDAELLAEVSRRGLDTEPQEG